MNKLNSLTLALTAFNEEASLSEVANKACEFLDTAAQDWQLVIVNDGSTDATRAIADDFAAARPRVDVVHHETNRGMGAAIRSAIKTAGCESFCVIAADGQVQPADLQVFCQPVMQGHYVFSTYSNRDDGFDRWLLTSGLRVIFLVLMGIWRVPTGNYFVPTEWAKALPLKSDSFVTNYEVYFNACRQRKSVAWVELPCAPRGAGKSKVRNLRTIWRVFCEVLRYRFSG